MSDPDPKQTSAIGHETGYLLVLAGPGSGKTRVLTERNVRLLRNSAGKSFRILALTFTNKAANEMRTRVVASESDEAPRSFLTTFHSFAADVLRQHGTHIGINPDFSMMTTDADRLILLRDVCSKLSDESDHLYIPNKDLLGALDEVYKETTPEDGLNFSKVVEEDEEGVPLAPLATAYMREAIARGELDFGLLICAAVYLLDLKPNIAKQIRIVYRHVNLDEFQDTNKGQADLLRHLIGSETISLFLVADDDQVIYEWNGASSAFSTSRLSTRFRPWRCRQIIAARHRSLQWPTDSRRTTRDAFQEKLIKSPRNLTAKPRPSASTCLKINLLKRAGSLLI